MSILSTERFENPVCSYWWFLISEDNNLLSLLSICILYAMLLNISHFNIRNIHKTNKVPALGWIILVKFREKSCTNLSLSFFYFHKLKKGKFITVLVKLFDGFFHNFWHFWSVTWYIVKASKTWNLSNFYLWHIWKRNKTKTIGIHAKQP